MVKRMKDVDELLIDMDSEYIKHMSMKGKRSKKYKDEIFKYSKNEYRK